jgi:tetratricopeptide (TPR) repeat protein
MAAKLILFGSGIASLVTLAFMVWFLWRWLSNSDEPVILVIRWIITGIVLGFVFYYGAHARNEFALIEAVLLAAVGGVIMIFVWRERFCGFVADRFGSLYTGGSAQSDPTPFYSIAQARRKQGKYQEAAEEVRTQLERFPTDFTGRMLLAEIQAEDLKDVTGALDSLEVFLTQEGHAPKNIAYALNRAADWHLKITQDREAARTALERIVALLPETEQAQLALQRIPHLTPPEMLAEANEPRRMAVPQANQRLGLENTPAGAKPVERDPADVAEGYVRHLETFPYDNEAREKLALLYARHYQRLDLASDQLEQLISFPNQPPKEVIRWLNLLADLQIEFTGDAELARQTLQRIVELHPRSAAAENALHRLAHLKLELRPKQQSQAIKLGSYRQNIGLHATPPGRADDEAPRT